MNWKEIISTLSEQGHTQPEIARFCACGQATISDLATGKTKSPRYEIGARLLELMEMDNAQQASAEPAAQGGVNA
jgi:predicted transcriptional regulator